jgi:general secretion pathway protein F
VSRGETVPIRRISADELIALNEEIAALVRAGIPLEIGLKQLGEEMPGRLGSVAAHIGDRLERGERLTDILSSDARAFPPVWRAVVAAGAKSGHLAAALEGMARTGRRVAELRRGVTAALLYPLIVASLAYVMLIITLRYFIPVVRSAHDDLTSMPDQMLDTLDSLGQTAHLWAPWPPVLVIIGLLFFWWWSGRAAWRRDKSGLPVAGMATRAWPGITSVLRDGRAATFAELLALMNEQRVPMHEAVVLAADASGDRRLREAATVVSERLFRGQTAAFADGLPAPFPPLIGWSLFAGVDSQALTETLRNSARLYRERAARTVRWAVIYLPIVLTAVIGGAAVFAQTLTVFVPLSRLLLHLVK